MVQSYLVCSKKRETYLRRCKEIEGVAEAQWLLKGKWGQVRGEHVEALQEMVGSNINKVLLGNRLGN